MGCLSQAAASTDGNIIGYYYTLQSSVGPRYPEEIETIQFCLSTTTTLVLFNLDLKHVVSVVDNRAAWKRPALFLRTKKRPALLRSVAVQEAEACPPVVITRA
jgi:hypothetical protein